MRVQQVKIDKLGIEVSRLGFGGMRFPLQEDGTIDRTEAAKLVDIAYQAGVNYFDTAYGYHNRESQVFFAEILPKYPRDSYYFATKLPIWLCDETTESVAAKFEEQMEVCNQGYFDFYLVHAMDKDRLALMRKNGAYDYLMEQKKAGRIRFLGFSFHGDLATFEALLQDFEWDFVQIQTNYIDDVMIDSNILYQMLCERGIPAIVMEPVRGGFLATPPQSVLDAMEAFEPKLEPAAWAFRWCMDKDNMPIILSGMSNQEQVEQNIKTFSELPTKLTADEAAFIDRIRDEILSIQTVPCTKCGYCMDCPFGVNIPRVFEIYNQYKLFPNKYRAGVNYAALIRENHDVTQCTRCGACEPLCPQTIPIPDQLAAVHEELEPFTKAV